MYLAIPLSWVVEPPPHNLRFTRTQYWGNGKFPTGRRTDEMGMHTCETRISASGKKLPGDHRTHPRDPLGTHKPRIPNLASRIN
jgi:hypothetical protein